MTECTIFGYQRTESTIFICVRGLMTVSGDLWLCLGSGEGVRGLVAVSGAW